MKKLLICITLLSMIGGKCFSQGDNPNHFYVPDELWDTFMKGYQLANEGKWAEAFPFYKYVADKGNVAYAQCDVAVCFQNGEGTSINLTEAFNYMYKAATNAKPWGNAFHGLGEYYRLGLGRPKNLEESFKWYYKGTGIEDIPFVIWDKEMTAKCMFKVGCAYLFGEGVKKNGDQAVLWLTKADENGYDKAAPTLAAAYLSGEMGVEKDEVEGVKWLKKAAEFDTYMQYQMGIVYRDGIGNISKDNSKALEWFKKAAANGYMPALDDIRKLER